MYLYDIFQNLFFNRIGYSSFYRFAPVSKIYLIRGVYAAAPDATGGRCKLFPTSEPKPTGSKKEEEKKELKLLD